MFIRCIDAIIFCTDAFRLCIDTFRQCRDGNIGCQMLSARDGKVLAGFSGVSREVKIKNA